MTTSKIDAVAKDLRSIIRERSCWLLIGLHLIFLFPVIIRQQVFFLRDIFHYYYPLKHLVIDLFSRGELPLWDESIFLGKSLIGDPSSGVFDPANLLYIFFSFDTAFQYFFVVHILLFAVGVYALIRQCGGSIQGAFLGAFSISFSPAFQFMTTHYSYFGAYSLIPWFGYTLVRFLEQCDLKRGIWLALVVSMQVLKSEPQTVYLEGLIAAGLLGVHFFRSDPKKRKKVLKHVAISLGLVLVLCSPQIWASWIFLQSSVRSQGLSTDAIFTGSLHPLRLLEFLIPYPFGNPLAGEIFRPPWLANQPTDVGPWAFSYYLGLPFLLGSLTCFPMKTAFKKKPVQVIFGLWVLFGFLALGKHLYALNILFHYLPGWTLFRYPEKFMIFSNMFFAMGLGLLWDRPRPGNFVRRAVQTFAFLNIVILLFLHWRTWPLADSAFFDNQPPLVSALKNEPSGRLYAYRDELGPKTPPRRSHFRTRTQDEWNLAKENVGVVFGIKYLAGYSSAVSQTFFELFHELKKNPRAHFNLYNVRFLVGHPEGFSDDDTTLTTRFENKEPLYVLKENSQALPEIFLVEGETIPVVENGRFTKPFILRGDGSVKPTLKNNHRKGFETTTIEGKNTWLVWTQNLDAFWKVTVNGEPATLHKIYPAVYTVALKPGRNQILFSYQIPGLAFLLVGSVLAFSLSLTYLIKNELGNFGSKKIRKESK